VSDKNVSVAVDAIKVSGKTRKSRSFDDDVEVYVPGLDDDEETVSKFEKERKKNKISAAAHAKKTRGQSVDLIFEKRMRLPGGTTPVEAGAAIVLLKEDVEGKMTKEKRRERNGIWTQKFLKWIEQFGDEVRATGGGLIGRGDRVEILTNGHYRFKW